MPRSARPVQAAGSTLRLLTAAALEEGLSQLDQLDPGGVRTLLSIGGRPVLRTSRSGFAGLAATVMAQQVSVASAAAIYARLAAAFDPLTPEAIRAAHTDVLRRCGLSAAKIRTLRAIAEAVAGGALRLDTLASLPADEAHAQLVVVKGIGPWTADVFLLFCLGHPDSFPAGDLALQEAARLVSGSERRLTAAELLTLAERWRPYRGVAAYLLWTCYRTLRGISTGPIPTLS
jgi:DNA-3-methyladenine glycosylase II